jgi:hypothetical protein
MINFRKRKKNHFQKFPVEVFCLIILEIIFIVRVKFLRDINGNILSIYLEIRKGMWKLGN